jgi:hypothetical protein
MTLFVLVHILTGLGVRPWRSGCRLQYAPRLPPLEYQNGPPFNPALIICIYGLAGLLKVPQALPAGAQLGGQGVKSFAVASLRHPGR